MLEVKATLSEIPMPVYRYYLNSNEIYNIKRIVRVGEAYKVCFAHTYDLWTQNGDHWQFQSGYTKNRPVAAD